MKTIFSLLITAFIPVIFSCNKSQHSFSKDEVQNLEMKAPPGQDKASDIELLKTQSDSTGGISLQGSAPGQNPDWDKKIIKTGFLKLEVKDFKLYNDIVHKAAKQYGGYVANEEQNQSEEKKESTISIKVPVDQFESIMIQLPTSAEKIIEKRITTEDVTGEVIDTKSRLHAKEQIRLKYLEFLKQAKNMEDVLKVQSEINDIQEEMESASGRINYLSHQSALSTIQLTFYQPLAGYNPVNDNPGFLTRLIAAFKTGFNFIEEFFIGAASIWPLFLFAIIAWLFFKRGGLALITAKQKL
jgi:Domain of unknown function (DUF4349)